MPNNDLERQRSTDQDQNKWTMGMDRFQTMILKTRRATEMHRQCQRCINLNGFANWSLYSDWQDYYRASQSNPIDVDDYNVNCGALVSCYIQSTNVSLDLFRWLTHMSSLVAVVVFVEIFLIHFPCMRIVNVGKERLSQDKPTAPLRLDWIGFSTRV